MFLKAGNTIVTLGFITYYFPFTKKILNKSGFVKGSFTLPDHYRLGAASTL